MKKSKIRIIIIFFLIFAVSALFTLNIALSKDDYANLIIEGDNNSYILLNDSQKYRYMPYYDYKFTPDIKIRGGKSFISSILNKSVGAYTNDSERNFLYCNQSGFGMQVTGLYIKETSLDDLFEPTSTNIYRIVVFDKNNTEQLIFDSGNEELFNCFIEKYSYELKDYFFPNNIKDEAVFNGEYAVHIEYQNGEILRFLRCLNKTEFEFLEGLSDGSLS